ncbi:MAG: hypothetical protein Q7T03_04120 [Deltaproteobacteria bacterium]|nr:hypothetical protein [Deltaproteobacteria bacterium]
MVELLPLKDPVFKKYPVFTLSGNYFGFQLALEGGIKKERHGREKGFRFLATLGLPKKISGRIFIQHESRKTSLKPIAGLKLVSTSSVSFNEHFLLLASDEKMAKASFQPYLCEKISMLSECNWQLDIHGTEAHFEVWQAVSNAPALAELLKVVIEILNATLVASA